MDTCESAATGARPVVGEIRDQLVEPFIAATCVALGEMASTEVVAGAISQQTPPPALGDIAAVVELLSATEGPLVLRFPQLTAGALAARMLAGVSEGVDENLICDCVGEIANVVAGQAKAMLADTPYRFTFSLPKVVACASLELQPAQGRDCLIVLFRCDVGEFALQLFLKL